MATTFPTPPTFANPVVVNPSTGENQFNPIWLQWFLVLSSFLSSTSEGRIRDIIPVTSAGTYQPSNGTNNILAFLWGGGGGGGTSAPTNVGQASVGGGGGAGGFCFALLTTGFTGQVFNPGGAGGSASNGGNTTFAGLTAFGGLAGTSGVAMTSSFTVGGAGGTSSGAILGGYGQNGEQGIVLSGTVASSGAGASSVFGQGGLSNVLTGTGQNAAGFAAGGSGGLSYQSDATGHPGGSGTPGCGLIVELT